MARRKELLERVFRHWIRDLRYQDDFLIGEKLASRANLTLTFKIVTQCTFLEFERELAGIGITVPSALRKEMIPCYYDFLDRWNESVSERSDRGTGLGPARALAMLEDWVFAQGENVPAQELQELWEAILEDSESLLHNSRDFREHVANIVQKHVREGHIPGHLDIQNLTDGLYDAAIATARHKTGPGELKQRGINAGEPRRIADAFKSATVTENLKQILNPRKVKGSHALTGPEIEQFLDRARQCCTADQCEYLKLRYKDKLKIQEIADRMGKALSTVHGRIKVAEEKVAADLRESGV
jgi:predicted DNA-binding protein (UPF0251 family)